MLTELGIILRDIRIQKEELLKDMAIKLNISSAFLSGIETGDNILTYSIFRNFHVHYGRKNAVKISNYINKDFKIKNKSYDNIEAIEASFIYVNHNLNHKVIIKIDNINKDLIIPFPKRDNQMPISIGINPLFSKEYEKLRLKKTLDNLRNELKKKYSYVKDSINNEELNNYINEIFESYKSF